MPTAEVTGASSGIGKAIALRLIQMDYDVIGISRHIKSDIIDSNINPVANIAEGIFCTNDVSINSPMTGNPINKPNIKKRLEIVEKNIRGL